LREAGSIVESVEAADTHKAIDAVWRIESARLIAGLARIVRDVGVAEDLAADALVAALEQWPREGIPRNPGAWLMTTAKHRAIDHVRRKGMLDRKHGELGYAVDTARPDTAETLNAALDDDIGDDLLRLVFTACHPVLTTEARVALTLRLLGGLTTSEIARAFLAPEPTIAQRIVRAKKTLAKEHVPYEVPRGSELAARLSSVLEVVYLIFNEGYSATAGDDWMRPALCDEAMRLGRVLAELAPLEPEVHGLVALMQIQASRSRARVGSGGAPILLLDQNRALWDQLLIRRGLAALDRAESVRSRRSSAFAEATADKSDRPASNPLAARGPYELQAAIAACHARARQADDTDWAAIVALYGELLELVPSPVVELNRAVAVSMASGPQAGLDLVDALTSVAALEQYHLLPSVRGDLLLKVGRANEARAEFERAAALTRNARERDLLLARARAATVSSMS
jgi:RNA polymerase sigma-70 factor, ECF subfamily